MGRNNYKVKFSNNKCHWYSDDRELKVGDLVFCVGVMEGVLGKVIGTDGWYITAFSLIDKIVGHIELEDYDDMNDLWKSLDKQQRINVLKNLGAKEPFTKQKFIDCVGNTWTVAGYNGTSWTQHLQSIRQLADIIPEEPVVEEEPPYTGEYLHKDGYLWKEIENVPEVEEARHKELMQGVVYGTKEMIDAVDKECKLIEITEFCDGIYRATTNDPSVIEKFPECKVAFFEQLVDAMGLVYSESGYPYVTSANIKVWECRYRSENEWVGKYYPDEIFRDTMGDFWEESYTRCIICNAPLDKQFRTMDYVVELDGKKYQMDGIDNDDPPYTENSEWVYRDCEGGIEICRYRGKEKNLVFPTEIDGKKVIGIADRFADSDEAYLGLESIIIPLGYRYIGAYAFAGCKNLKKVELPETLSKIRDGAFLKCTKLEDIVLPSRLTYFYYDYENKNGGSFIFFGCNRLETIKSYAKKIKDDNAFILPSNCNIKYVEMSEDRINAMVDWIIKEYDHLVVYDFMEKTADVEVGERLRLQYVPGEEGIKVTDSSGNRLGLIMSPSWHHIDIWDGYRFYIDRINAVATSRKHSFMAGKGFDIQLIKAE